MYSPFIRRNKEKMAIRIVKMPPEKVSKIKGYRFYIFPRFVKGFKLLVICIFTMYFDSAFHNSANCIFSCYVNSTGYEYEYFSPMHILIDSNNANLNDAHCNQLNTPIE